MSKDEAASIVNKAEDCILYLRLKQFIRESEVTSIRRKIEKFWNQHRGGHSKPTKIDMRDD